jgi:hypothetical protein
MSRLQLVYVYTTTDAFLVLETDISTTQQQILALAENKSGVALGFGMHGGLYTRSYNTKCGIIAPDIIAHPGRWDVLLGLASTESAIMHY